MKTVNIACVIVKSIEDDLNLRLLNGDDDAFKELETLIRQILDCESVEVQDIWDKTNIESQ